MRKRIIDIKLSKRSSSQTFFKRSLINRGVLPQGKISWVSDYEVEIFSLPRIPKDHSETADDYKSIYNVQTGKTINNKGASN